MTRTEVMKELRSAGSAQTLKIYRRHGVQGKAFGVGYAALGKLKKKIKTDQALAEELWGTGNHDARILATMIADPSAIGARTLERWARDLDCRGLAGALSNVAAAGPFARKHMEKWTASKSEMIGCAGWHVLASMARQDDGGSDAFFRERIKTIETTIHGSKNWVKYAMNNALINIGIRNPALEKAATAAAKRIGGVEVDHGETGCTTPDAASYIRKTLAHQRKKAAKRARA